jgi:hypothetical protein
MAVDDPRITAVFARIDAANAEDPNRVEVDGRLRPAALVYGERMSACLAAFDPEASPVLAIAVRAQHLRRFDIPRASHPMGRTGYFAWRNALKAHHADLVTRYMRDVGFDATAIDRVGAIVRKERLKRDPETQTLEDCACLVFLEFELPGFAAKWDDDKLVDVLAKTWPKMSDLGRARALELVPKLSERLAALVVRAVSSPVV